MWFLRLLALMQMGRICISFSFFHANLLIGRSIKCIYFAFEG